MLTPGCAMGTRIKFSWGHRVCAEGWSERVKCASMHLKQPRAGMCTVHAPVQHRDARSVCCVHVHTGLTQPPLVCIRGAAFAECLVLCPLSLG